MKFQYHLSIHSGCRFIGKDQDQVQDDSYFTSGLNSTSHQYIFAIAAAIQCHIVSRHDMQIVEVLQISTASNKVQVGAGGRIIIHQAYSAILDRTFCRCICSLDGVVEKKLVLVISVTYTCKDRKQQSTRTNSQQRIERKLLAGYMIQVMRQKILTALCRGTSAIQSREVLEVSLNFVLALKKDQEEEGQIRISIVRISYFGVRRFRIRFENSIWVAQGTIGLAHTDLQ